MSRALPSISQVRQLPRCWDGQVTADMVDENDHMSLHFYVCEAAFALWELQKVHGLSHHFERGQAFMAIEQHTTYAGELRLGDRYSGYVRFLARADRAMHSVTYIVDEERDRPSCVVESVNLFVDLGSRRAVSIPDDLATGIDSDTAAHAALDWAPDLCEGLWRT